MNETMLLAEEIGPVFARIYDVNISGYLPVERETLAELADEIDRYRGLWHDYTGDGVAILDNPAVDVYLTNPEESFYEPERIYEIAFTSDIVRVHKIH